MRELNKTKKIKVILSILFFFLIIFAIVPSVFAKPEVQYVNAIVFFKKGVYINDIPEVEYKYHYENFNGFAGKMPYSTYQKLEGSWFVKSIELDQKIVRPVWVGDRLNWGVDDIDAERVWGGYDGAVNVTNPNVAGKGVKVCIIDTGIRYDHEDLWYNYIGGYDYVDDDDDPMEGDFNSHHGTAVAGIIAAMDNEMGYIGVAPNVSLYVVRIFSSDTDTCDMSDLIDAIIWACNNGMDIISMSFSGGNSYALGYVIWFAYQQGIVLVAASGNYPEGGNHNVVYPAIYDQVIAVGAVEKVDEEYVRASYSCYGPQLDVVAPTDVYTTYGYFVKYAPFSGTSAACPFVAGVCALILSKYPDLTPAEVKDILVSRCFDLGPPGRDDEYGNGLVNAYAIFDTIPPEVTITSPTHGSDVSRVAVLIEADASDDLAIKRVRCKIDNNLWLVDDTEAPYQWIWDTTGHSPGSYHTITSIAYDYAGNYAEDQITVRIRTIGGGGGGCPILFAYDGTEYIEEGLLDIHNPEGIDVETIHTLITKPEAMNHRYLLRLMEHPKTISHIDKVQLFGRLPHGQLTPLSLTSAVHSALGQVKWTLLLSDDVRVDILGADHNEGSSEFIELEFNAPAQTNFIEFIFVIEGYNIYVK